MGYSALVLDDDIDVAEIVAAMLTSFGAQARFVTSAAAFFHELESGPVDVVVVDLQMPGQDGLEVVRSLETGNPVQIILTSGCDPSVLEEARQSARRSGHDIMGILPKPVRRNALRGILDSARDRFPADGSTSERGPAMVSGKGGIGQ